MCSPPSDESLKTEVFVLLLNCSETAYSFCYCLKNDVHTSVPSGLRAGHNHWRPGVSCRVGGIITESYSPTGGQLVFAICLQEYCHAEAGHMLSSALVFVTFSCCFS